MDSSTPDAATLLQRQSLRWLNLSATFWLLVISESSRAVDQESLSNFVEALHWRARGQIKDIEFTALYLEWYKKVYSQSSRSTVNVSFVRDFFIQRYVNENDLDLFVGLLVNENNKMLTEEAISYSSSSSISRTRYPTNSPHRFLEFCDRDWLDLSEDLFFSLDTPGYGILTHDEVLFFTSCLVIGQRRWVDESDFYARLSSKELITAAAKLVREMSGKMDDSDDGCFPPCITLNAFKRYLIACRVNQAGLSVLVSFVRSSIETMARFLSAVVVGEEEEEELLSLSMHPIENGTALGSPRMWQRAVIEACGYDFNACHIDGRAVGPAPLVLLFMLSADVEAYIGSDFRLADITMASNDAATQDIQHATGNVRQRFELQSNVMDVAIVATTAAIWHGFNAWAKGQQRAVFPSANYAIHQYERLRHDPVFAMILAAVVEYRILLEECSNAIRQVASVFYGKHGGHEESVLGSVCSQLATLVPTFKSDPVKSTPVESNIASGWAVAADQPAPYLNHTDIASVDDGGGCSSTVSAPVSPSKVNQISSPEIYAESLRKIFQKMSSNEAGGTPLKTFESTLELSNQIIAPSSGRAVPIPTRPGVSFVRDARPPSSPPPLLSSSSGGPSIFSSSRLQSSSQPFALAWSSSKSSMRRMTSNGDEGVRSRGDAFFAQPVSRSWAQSSSRDLVSSQVTREDHSGFSSHRRGSKTNNKSQGFRNSVGPRRSSQSTPSAVRALSFPSMPRDDFELGSGSGKASFSRPISRQIVSIPMSNLARDGAMQVPGAIPRGGVRGPKMAFGRPLPS